MVGLWMHFGRSLVALWRPFGLLLLPWPLFNFCIDRFWVLLGPLGVDFGLIFRHFGPSLSIFTVIFMISVFSLFFVLFFCRLLFLILFFLFLFALWSPLASLFGHPSPQGTRRLTGRNTKPQ